jgi:Lrp/AsnC family transcriptional regulator, leucine-responsive regulatory protein
VLGRERIGLGVTVFVGMKIDGHADDRADELTAAVTAMPEVVAFHMVSGEFDYLLEVVVPDLAHYQRFLLDKLLAMPIVKEVRSNIALPTHKAGAPLPLGHLRPKA